MKMKDDEMNVVTCATVTMELGIDIGKLERFEFYDRAQRSYAII